MSNVPRKTILIVDDDSSFRNLLAYLLTNAGFRIAQAGNGYVALDLLTDPRSHVPDLILLDLSMPLMDGWKFRALQLKNPEIAAIPVVVITSAKTEDAGLDSIQAKGYLKKPLQSAQLIEIVKANLAEDPSEQK